MSTATATKIFADRIGRIEVSATMAITAAALKLKAEGMDLADFGAGEPHFTRRSTSRTRRSRRSRRTSRGTRTWPARRRCARRSWIGTRPTSARTTRPEECVFTTGGKLALFNAVQVLVDHGDEVILPVPYWVSLQGHHPVCGRQAGVRRERTRRRTSA